MKAIILAAGRGSRMNEGTANIPKCMMKLGGKTLLDRCVEGFLVAGFKRCDIGIVTGYKSEAINIEGVQYFHNADWESTNMFISLTKAKAWLQNEVCIVSYSDIVYRPSTITKLVENDGELAITYYSDYWVLWSKRFDNPLDDLETFKIEGDKLIEIGSKPMSRDEIQGQFMGLLRFSPKGWGMVERAIEKPMSKPLDELDMTTLLQHLISLGHTIDIIPVDDLWLECDNQKDIQVYESEYLGLLCLPGCQKGH